MSITKLRSALCMTVSELKKRGIASPYETSVPTPLTRYYLNCAPHQPALVCLFTRVDVRTAATQCVWDCFGVVRDTFLCLFFETVYIVIRKKGSRTTPTKVFFVATLVLFALITSHIAVNLYRLLRGYVWLAAEVGPATYFGEVGRWDNIAHDAINAVVTWIGDSLLIYRCYLVWEGRIIVVILPIILLMLSVVSNVVALHLFSEVAKGTIFAPTLVPWMTTIASTAFAQNTITTTLIAYRIWRMDRLSRGAGLRADGARSPLIPIVRIVVESAMLYSITVLILIILYVRDNNGQYVMQEVFVPVVGIVFALINLRVALRSIKPFMTTAHLTTLHFRDRGHAQETQETANESDRTLTHDEKEPKEGAGEKDGGGGVVKVQEVPVASPLESMMIDVARDEVNPEELRPLPSPA